MAVVKVIFILILHFDTYANFSSISFFFAFSEEILSEVFSQVGGGPIATIRLSKKNFCHIRFTSESSVENSIRVSGFRMRIGNFSDAPNTGKLHVDYAQV